jgi:hypothetical protein
MPKKFPNYIYKVESDCCPTTYFDSVQKVTELVIAHCQRTLRKETSWHSAGKFRVVSCVDRSGSAVEYDMHSNRISKTHAFVVEQIEVQ